MPRNPQIPLATLGRRHTPYHRHHTHNHPHGASAAVPPTIVGLHLTPTPNTAEMDYVVEGNYLVCELCKSFEAAGENPKRWKIKDSSDRKRAWSERHVWTNRHIARFELYHHLPRNTLPRMGWTCHNCSDTFTRRDSLVRHLQGGTCLADATAPSTTDHKPHVPAPAIRLRVQRVNQPNKVGKVEIPLAGSSSAEGPAVTRGTSEFNFMPPPFIPDNTTQTTSHPSRNAKDGTSSTSASMTDLQQVNQPYPVEADLVRPVNGPSSSADSLISPCEATFTQLPSIPNAALQAIWPEGQLSSNLEFEDGSFCSYPQADSIFQFPMLDPIPHAPSPSQVPLLPLHEVTYDVWLWLTQHDGQSDHGTKDMAFFMWFTDGDKDFFGPHWKRADIEMVYVYLYGPNPARFMQDHFFY